MDLIKYLNEKNLKSEVPVINVGDTVRVHVRIKEGNKERVQVFEGTIIAKKHGGVEETFTVRRVSYGVGVEKVFPVHSPQCGAGGDYPQGQGAPRQARGHSRDRVGKAAKVKGSV